VIFLCRPYAEPVKLKELLEDSKMFTLQLPWAKRLSEVLREADSWTSAAQQLLVSHNNNDINRFV